MSQSQYPLPSRLLLIFVLAALLCICVFQFRLNHYHHSVSRPVIELRTEILEKLAHRAYDYRPANDPSYHFVGRWTSTAHGGQLDTASTGAYVEFQVSNATTVILSLQNSKQPGNDRLTDKQKAQHNQLTIRQYVGEPQSPVSIVAEIDGTCVVNFDSERKGLAALSLEREKTHRIRLSLIETPTSVSGAGTLQFRGVWVSKGAMLIPRDSAEHDDGHLHTQHSTRGLPARRKSFELVTDTIPPGSARDDSTESDVSKRTISQIMTWDRQLANYMNADFTRLTLGYDSLVCAEDQSQGSCVTTQDLYFRAGPPSTPLFSHAYSFSSHPPDVLIVQLGTNDAAHLEALRTQTPPAPSHQVHKHLDAITTAYATFIKSIRKSAYPGSSLANDRDIEHSTTASLWQQDHLYNSAPAILPIFILPPLNAPSYFTAALQSLVYDLLTKEGDTSLHLIDTKGWFQSTDFVAISSSSDAPPDPRSPSQFTLLTAQAQMKFTTYMHQHLCPYLSTDPDEECSFRQHDIHTGKVYVPVEDELEKVLLESKIRKVKEGLFGSVA